MAGELRFFFLNPAHSKMPYHIANKKCHREIVTASLSELIFKIAEYYLLLMALMKPEA